MTKNPGAIVGRFNLQKCIYQFICSCLLVLFALQANSQHINDCATAQVVCDNEHLSFNPQGPGIDDFADPDNIPGCIVSLEQNSAWYYFEIDPAAPPNLTLGFIIHPDGGLGEDYDWALFGPDVTCGDLGAPIRCSSSSNMCGFCPETGMGMGTTDVSEGPGTGDGFVMTLQVQPGQGFYLMIDNWLGTSNGFDLEWTDSAAEYLNCNAVPPCALEAVAGDDISACEGDDTVILIEGGSTGNHGNETYSWEGTNGGTAFLSDPDVANPSITIPAGFTGTIRYTLTVVEDTCMGMDAFDLIVNPLPSVTIEPIGPFCENNSAQTLSAMPLGGVWGGAATGSSFNPMTNGPGLHTVTYTYTDINDCTNTASLDIEVYELPEAAINPDPAEFCDSEGSVLLTATGSGGGGNYLFNWNTPTGTGEGPTYVASLSGAHHITVTDANGCTNTNVITVESHANPEVEINDPGPICASEEYVQLTATPSGGEFSGTIISADGEIYPNLVTPGTYSISYTYIDGNNCDGTDFETITILSTPNAVASNNTPLCAGNQVLLFGSTDSTGAAFTYQWTGPNGYTSNIQNPTNATQAGFYNLYVLNGQCPSPAAVTEVVLTSQPDALASNDGPYCNGQAIHLYGSTNTAGSQITYAWSGPGGYTSNAQNPNNATMPGLYTLIITVDNCSSMPSNTQVIFSTPPDAVASNTGPYCTGELIQLTGNTNTSGSTISYSWTGPNGYTSNAQNPSDATQQGTYQLIVNVDGCSSAITPTQVIIHPLPTPAISGQSSFCTGNTATLNAGGGYLSYAWNDGTSNQTLQVTSSGTYQVTVTDMNGCSGSSSFTVTETPSLTPMITGALSFCEGTSTILDAGIGYTSYLWSTGETNQSITVTDEGNYGVLVMDADGCSGSANITTSINPNPDVMIGGSTTYCIGGSTILDAGAGYASYAWNNASTSQTITVSSPGIYSVDVIDTNGCYGSGSVMVEESTELHPVITGNTAFCENGNTTLNAGSGFATYLWSDGSTSQNLYADTPGTYSVSVSDGQGCNGESSVDVVEVLPPFAVLDPGKELCNTIAGGSVINLYDLITGGDMSGTWTDVDNSGAVGLFDNLDFNNIPAGDYQFTYTTNSAVSPCPEVSYDVIITILDCACPDVFFLNVPALCNEGDVIDLADIENTTENGEWTLVQTPSGPNPATLNGSLFNAAGSDPGTYTLQFNLENQPPPGCPVDFEITIDVDAAVDAGISNPAISYCFEDNALVTLADLISGEDLNGTWNETSLIPSTGNAFNSAGGTFRINSQTPGNYTFNYVLQSNNACPDDAAEVTIIINPLPTVTIANIGMLDCKNLVQTLDANGSSWGPEYVISWSGPGVVPDGNETTLHPTIDKAGLYTLSITNGLTGCTDDASVTVLQNSDAPRTANIISQDPPCFGDLHGSINIVNVIGGTPPYQSSLNNQPFSNAQVYSNLPQGNYTLIIEDATGCRWDTLITLEQPSQSTITLGPDLELEFGDEATIEAIVNLPSDQIDTLIWLPDNIIECFDFDCLEGTIQAFNTTTLTATLVDLNGCEVSDEIIITVKKHRRLFIPTVFSPNDDGVNDVFYIFGSDRQIEKIRSFVIYNRWGDVLYEANDFLPNDQTKGWDGRFKDQPVNPGVFVFTTEIEYKDGLIEVVTGDITLVK